MTEGNDTEFVMEKPLFTSVKLALSMVVCCYNTHKIDLGFPPPHKVEIAISILKILFYLYSVHSLEKVLIAKTEHAMHWVLFAALKTWSEFTTRMELGFISCHAFVFQPDIPAANGFVCGLCFVPLAATRSSEFLPDSLRINTTAVFCQRQTKTQLTQMEDCVTWQWETAERLETSFSILFWKQDTDHKIHVVHFFAQKSFWAASQVKNIIQWYMRFKSSRWDSDT